MRRSRKPPALGRALQRPGAAESESFGHQSETVVLGRLPQVAVPADEGDAFDCGKSQRCGEMEAVVGTQAVVDCRLRSALDHLGGDRVYVDPPPEPLQVVHGRAELRSRNSTAAPPPRQSGYRLDIAEHACRSEQRGSVGLARQIAAGLVDEQLDERARIDIEAQRRPSETY